MMLLDRRRRPCLWVFGDNRCGPSISGEKEMARGTSREDLEVLDARVTMRERISTAREKCWGGGKRERGDEGGTTAQNSKLESGGSGCRGHGVVSFLPAVSCC
jgi:hypothetical protein